MILYHIKQIYSSIYPQYTYFSTIFRTIDDKNDLSGQRIVNIFKARKIAQEQATQQLNTDIECLKKYELACKNGTVTSDTFTNTMNGASKEAQAYAESIKEGTGSAKVYADTQKRLQSSLKATSAESKIAAFGIKTLSLAFNMLSTMAISYGLQLLIGLFSDLANAQENAIEKANEVIGKFEEQRDALASNKETIESISSDYEKLAKGVDSLGRNVSLNSEEYSKYNNIVNQIADMFPQMVQGYTDEGNAIIKHKGNVEELTKAYKEQKDAAQDAIIVGSADVFKGFKAKVDHNAGFAWEESGLLQMKNVGQDLIQKLDSGELDYGDFRNQNSLVLQDFLQYAGVDLGTHWTDGGYEEELKTERAKIVSAIDNLIRDINTETAKIKPIMQAYLDQSFDFQGIDEKAQDVVKQIVGQFDSEFYAQFNNETEMATWVTENVVDKFKGKDGEKMAIEFGAMFDLQTKFNDGDITVTEYQEKLTAFLSLIDTLPDETQKAIKLLFGITTNEDGTTSSDVDTMVANVKEKFKGKFEKEIGQLTLDELEILTNLDISPDGIKDWSEVETLIANAGKEANKMTDSLKDVTKTLSTLQSKYDELKSAQDEYNSTGAISADTMQKLIDNDLLQYLDFSSGKLQVNTDALLAEGEAAKVAAIQNLQKAMAEDLAAVAAGRDAEASTLAQTAIAGLGNNAETAGNQAETAAGQLAGFAVAAEAAKKGAEGNLGEGVNVDDYRAKADAIISAYTSAANSIGNITIASPKSSGSKKSDTSDKIKDTSDKIKDINEQLDDLAKSEALDALKYKFDQLEQSIEKVDNAMSLLDIISSSQPMTLVHT